MPALAPLTAACAPCAHRAAPNAFRAASRACAMQTSRRRIVARSGKGDSGIGEDVLARLRAAEEEAARLRKELEQAQSGAKVRY